jgi:pyruvate dehydrogenase E2 component (dihydrolipoamide acetyltransferase)
MYEFKFPDVGEGITEGKLVKWLVKEGDEVKKEQTVANVETDKAVVEIPTPVSGTVLKLLAEEQQTIYVGKPFILINDGTTGFSAPEQTISKSYVKDKPKKVEEPTAIPPPLKEEPAQLEKSREEIVSAPKSLPLQSSSKIILTLPLVRKAAKENNIDLRMIRGTGKDGRILLKDVESYTGQKISMDYLQSQISNQKSISIQTSNQTSTQLLQKTSIIPLPGQSSPDSSNISHHNRNDQKEILATPSTRQLARELNVDIYTIHGSGHSGLITREDVENAAKISTKQNPIPKLSNAQTPLATIMPSGGDEIIPLTSIRQAIAKRMSESWSKAVHVMVSDDADVTELVNIRNRNADAYMQHNIKLTFLPFFVKAVILALQKHPKLNATLDEQNNQIIQKHYYNIGIAADTQLGLMVPVIKNAEKRNIPEIALAINDLATRARNKSLKLEEMTGGTFTITNIGSIQGQMFTQIINYPEAAILGIGRIVEKPVVKDGQLVIRKIVVLSVTADHRIIDGADVAKFLKTLISYVENPDDIFMEMML